MRKNRQDTVSDEFKIMILDDEEGIVDSVGAMLTRAGYWSRGFTNPLKALEALESERYDLLVLDYFMQPIHGDEVVSRIRLRDKELYILLLTGHKELAPPVSTHQGAGYSGLLRKERPAGSAPAIDRIRHQVNRPDAHHQAV